MTRDARAYWLRSPAPETTAKPKAVEDFDHIKRRLDEIRAENERALRQTASDFLGL